MPDTTAIVGYAASVASISAFVPQLWKVIATRETKGLSTPMWIAEVVTFTLWTAYGFATGELPIIVTNVTCGVMAAVILGMKLALRRGSRATLQG